MAEQTAVANKTSGRGPRRWDPLEMFDEMRQEMVRAWGQAWPMAPRPVRQLAGHLTFLPAADVYESAGSLVIKVEIPGIKKEDIDVSLDDGDLVVRGERQAESEVKEEYYYRMERSYGKFYRRLPLPFEVKPDQVQATVNDGVLEIRVPKPTEPKPEPQKIPIA